MSVFKFYLYKPMLFPNQDGQYMRATIITEAPQMVCAIKVSNNIANDKELINNEILKLKMQYIKEIMDAEFELKDVE